jgi:hypothetical protein
MEQHGRQVAGRQRTGCQVIGNQPSGNQAIGSQFMGYQVRGYRVRGYRVIARRISKRQFPGTLGLPGNKCFGSGNAQLRMTTNWSMRLLNGYMRILSHSIASEPSRSSN